MGRSGTIAAGIGGGREFLETEEPGDKNTKFFLGTTKQRRARNCITGILKPDGTWTEKESEIKITATQYFQEMFLYSVVSDLETSLSHVPLSVTAAMNKALPKEFTGT